MKKEKVAIRLLHDAKRVYVYEYALDGKLTISKRLTVADEIDFLDAIEDGKVEIVNSSDATEFVDFPGLRLDVRALNAFSDIIGVLEKTGKMPQ